MKKGITFVLIVLCVLVFAISYASARDIPEKEIIVESRLPASLEIIGEEAFDGTALTKIELPSTVIQVGERAFANILSLREVSIPYLTRYIASNAFEGSNRTTITAPANSYARTYARTKDIPFSPIVMLCASTQASVATILSISRSKEILESDSSVRPILETQWKRIEEINITRTEELIANHVQGRAPPIV